MSIEWFRDLVICIFGLGATLVLVIIGVVVVVLYFKIKPIIESSKSAVKRVENISACVEEEVARPLARVVAVVQGITQVAGMVSRFSKKKEGGKHG